MEVRVSSCESVTIGSTNLMTYNPEDDFLYINGIKYKLAGLVWDGYYYNSGTNGKKFAADPSSFRTGNKSYTVQFASNYIEMSCVAQGVTGNGIGIVSDNVNLTNFTTFHATIKKTAHGNGVFQVALGEKDTMNGTYGIDSTSTYVHLGEWNGGSSTYEIVYDLTKLTQKQRENCAVAIALWAGYSGTETIQILSVWVD